MPSKTDKPTIIVVGAGPVGLLTTLRLAQASIPVLCLEAQTAIEASPRAMAYHPVAVRELDRAGVLNDVRKVGSQGRGICWRQTRGKREVIAKMERTVVNEDFPFENLVVGQHLLAEVTLRHLGRYEGMAEVRFGCKVTAVRDDCHKIELDVEDMQRSDGGMQTLSCDYVVAADGGRSTMRRLLDIPFEGLTYEEQLVSTNVYFPFDRYGWEDANFCIDPEHWALIARINNDGLWRVSYCEKPGLTEEQIRERQAWKFGELFPGGDSEEDGERPRYRLEQMSPYRLNQRCASTFRKGRVLLAGDAAHLCNPFGALGLTGGILDAGAVSDALIGMYQGITSSTILDKYAEVRRQIFVDTVNPQSQANKTRMHDAEPGTLGERDPFLKMLREASAEEKEQVRANARLAVDMSEFFDECRAG